MAYDTGELIKLSLEAIKVHSIARVTYLLPHLPCSHQTFYTKELDKHEGIKKALYNKRAERKKKLIDKWEESDNATLSIAAFKLLADEDELERLNNKVEIDLLGSIKLPKLSWSDDNNKQDKKE